MKAIIAAQMAEKADFGERKRESVSPKKLLNLPITVSMIDRFLRNFFSSWEFGTIFWRCLAMGACHFFAKESLRVAETYPLSPITVPVQPASTSSAQETSCKFPGFREKLTNFREACRTRCNFNPNVVETDEWAQFAIFLNVLWFSRRTFLHTGSGVESM